MSRNILDKVIAISHISNKKIAIIGYGNQGRAQALNLKDSGLNLKIGLRKNSKSKEKVERDQLDWMEIKDAVKWADLISIMLPDKVAPEVFRNDIVDNLNSGDTLLFSRPMPPNNLGFLLVFLASYEPQ